MNVVTHPIADHDAARYEFLSHILTATSTLDRVAMRGGSTVRACVVKAWNPCKLRFELLAGVRGHILAARASAAGRALHTLGAQSLDGRGYLVVG